MALTLESAVETLAGHRLLREIIQGDSWFLDPGRLPDARRPFTGVSYDSRTVTEGALYFCKGSFKPDYLVQADRAGMAAYVSETPMNECTGAPGIIVNDVRKAMSLLAADFYGHPEDDLALVGITGTKGKTTTAYYVQGILNRSSGGRAALLSSVDNCLDGKHYEESQLTTPESLDLFRMIRQAVDGGMRYLVMEVSSQAYKVDRVYGLTFDVGAFLNISPDHISPIEHPTFEDYLYCKRRIVQNCRRLVLGSACGHADLIREDAGMAGVPVTTFALSDRQDGSPADGDFMAVPVDQADEAGGLPDTFLLYGRGKEIGRLTLSMDGDFNGLNAAAAMAIVSCLGLNPGSDDLTALSRIRVSGRMERFCADSLVVYVDYAHNQASVGALLDFVEGRYGERDPRVTLITGSAGGKAQDRRSGIITAAQDRVDEIILTTDDPGDESAEEICRQMAGFVTNREVEVRTVIDRTEAIRTAVDQAGSDGRFDVVLVIGKGEERWIKSQGRHLPYEGDDRVVARLLSDRSPATPPGEGSRVAR
ncbi:UDP-N-acetylmuramoyl-L-alanyl-D-glutamate--2,6-diaminopimelate ligase [Bifidobacterium favimelis]|uniref:UDP-N-acetylmuramoyl-L-alanyl-D-glutamate--2, 6-diaminopimelate ligase n=1 Tax=Bifidobacterium favimelis TaxID=3122979 RepID=A0ABU8ZNK1_9BIFI